MGKNKMIRLLNLLKEIFLENDPKTGTGKKPKGSGRRLYTDENPKDTVSIKFKTKEDIVDTLNKNSFKSKSHARQSQIINLIHQRVRAAYSKAKDPEVKSRLKRALDYIENRKESSKAKTQRLNKLKETSNPQSGKAAPYGSGYAPIKNKSINELRQGLLNYLKQQLPNFPDYVIQDWVYKMIKKDDNINTAEGIQDWIDNQLKDLKWETKTNFPITMDIFGDKTQQELKSRIGGEIRQDVDKDIERHKTQQKLLKSQGISKEPIILFKTKDGKYELGEGWHRTTQAFKMYPEGFIQPNVYIGLNAKWLNEILKELVTDTKVICDNCGWKWDIAKGGSDLYICHKCNHDNTPKQLNEKCWKGYTQKGTKMMFGKKYPNCVKK